MPAPDASAVLLTEAPQSLGMGLPGRAGQACV